MHEYSVLGHERKKIYYLLAFLSGLLSPALLAWTSQVSSFAKIQLVAPSGLAIFGLLSLLFDRILWKWSFFYKLGIIRIPNLNGRWIGYITSARRDYRIPVVIMIYQTYSRIRVRLETESKEASSLSLMASLEMVDPNCFNLNYEYLSETKSSSGGINRHYGVTRLTLKSENDKFEGEQRGFFYTDRERNSYGDVAISRQGNPKGV
jgi:hypothetical protein